MLIPSYAELMDVLNQESNQSKEITSRYTIVIAAAKRARQLIQGDEPMVDEKKGKPLSTAVNEIYKNKIKVVPEGEGTVLIFKNSEEETNEKDKLNLFKVEIDNSTLNKDFEDLEDLEDLDSLEEPLDNLSEFSKNIEDEY